MRVVRPPGMIALAWVAALGMVATPAVVWARHTQSEQELRARLARESNPVKRVKIEIRLAALKLEQAGAAFDKDQTTVGAKLLDAYYDDMKEAWRTLESSGRSAARKPGGFIDLDIALRENTRALTDLKERTPYTERTQIERVAAQAAELHGKVLTALFPGSQLAGPAPPPRKSGRPPMSALRPAGSLQ